MATGEKSVTTGLNKDSFGAGSDIGLDEFSRAGGTPIKYRVTLKDGSIVEMTKTEKENLLNRVVSAMDDWLFEQRMMLPEDEYERIMLNYMNFLNS